jgi:3-oxoacyl-[acyl-carrier protein] reductase
MNRSNPLAIVTGASRGLGRLIAIELAAANVDVLAVARDPRGLEQSAAGAAVSGGGEVFAMVCDLEGADAALQIAAAAQAHGGASILVNNAAIQGPIGPSWETDAAEFERAMRVDFLVPVALTHAVLPDMIARREGWIVNVSGGGATAPRPMFSAYGAAKTALVRYGETLAAEVAQNGVRVNSVAPGAFASGMTRAILADGDRAGASERAGAERSLAVNDDANAVKAASLIRYLVAGAGRDVSGKLISAVWDPWNEMHLQWDALRASDVYTLRRIVPADRKPA